MAIAFYGLSTKAIMELLQKQAPEVLQVWFADDATGAGEIRSPKIVVGWESKRRDKIRVLR